MLFMYYSNHFCWSVFGLCYMHVSHSNDSSGGNVKVDRNTDKGTRFTNMVALEVKLKGLG